MRTPHWLGQTGGGAKRYFGLGFGTGAGFELARELVPLLGFALFLALLLKPVLTLTLAGILILVYVLWRTRHLWHESKEARERREARERWNGGRK